jgi:hypothetical protein
MIRRYFEILEGRSVKISGEGPVSFGVRKYSQ